MDEMNEFDYIDNIPDVDESDPKTEELMNIFRRDSAGGNDSAKAKRKITARSERLKAGRINVLAAVISLTAATVITVGIPTLAAVLAIRSAKKKKS